MGDSYVVFSLIYMSYVLYEFYISLKLNKNSSSWFKASAHIELNDVDEFRGMYIRERGKCFRYRFNVEGEVFYGDCIYPNMSCRTIVLNFFASKRKLCEKYKDGQVVDVFYDPGDPSNNALNIYGIKYSFYQLFIRIGVLVLILKVIFLLLKN